MKRYQQGARSYSFNSFATIIKVLAAGFIAVLLRNKSEQARLVLPPTLEVCSGSGRGGALAAPIHATALAPEAGSDWLSKLKGCAWGLG